MWIFLILGLLFIANGFLIYKLKLFRYAYMLFYMKSIEKYMDINKITDKEKFCNIVGSNQILLGVIVSLIAMILYGLQGVAIVIEMVVIVFMGIYIRRSVRNL